MEKTISLKIDGKICQYPEGTKYHEIALAHEDAQSGRILLVLEGTRLRELHHTAVDGAEVSFITLKDADGRRAYYRGLCLMMLRAMNHVSGHSEDCEVAIHYIVSDGLYCTLKNPDALTDQLLEETEAYMRDLVNRRVRIRKNTVSTTEAVKLFHKQRMYDKEQLFRYRLSSRTNLYDLEGFVDYYYGYMVYDTSYLPVFGLRRFEDGFVLQSPTKESPDRLPEFEPDRKLFAVQHKSLEWGRKLNILDVGDLNDKIVRGEMKELILTQEAYHEKQIAEIAQQIASDPARRIVMIAGPSSSGKTTFSHRLSVQLSVYGLTPHPIPVDDYFVDREKTPLNEDGSYNFECLEAIDIEQFNEDMTRLLAGEDVQLPTFNFKTGKREYKGKHLQLGSNDILVIEGIHCLNDRLSYALPRESKFKVYISALTQLSVDEHNRIGTTDGRLLRRMIRDARTRGTQAAGTIAMWPSVRRGEENHIFPYQESADVMFNSALIYELAVLKVYAQPLLFGIPQDSKEYVEAKRLLKFLDYFVPMSAEQIPNNSLLREFIGGSCFDV